MKDDYQKALKKVTLSSLLNPVPFNRQNYQKQKGPGTIDQWLFRLQNKFRKIIFLEQVYMRFEVNSNRFELSNRFEMSFRLHCSLHGDFTAAAFQAKARLYCTCANDIF